MNVNCKELGVDLCYACRNVGSNTIQCNVALLYNVMKSFSSFKENTSIKKWFHTIVSKKIYSASLLIKVARKYYPDIAEEFERISILI